MRQQDTKDKLTYNFNPRTPWRVRRYLCDCAYTFTKWFQSTHSMKSATWGSRCLKNSNGTFQSTHSMKSATDMDISWVKTKAISIHALHEECDRWSFIFNFIIDWFQSTHSMKSATRTIIPNRSFFWVFQSTHSMKSATFPNIIISCFI